MQLAPEIVEQLLKLPKAERLELATRLIQDIEPAELEFDLDPLWVQEIEARLAKVDSGDYTAVEWPQAIESLRKELAQRKVE